MEEQKKRKNDSSSQKTSEEHKVEDPNDEDPTEAELERIEERKRRLRELREQHELLLKLRKPSYFDRFFVPAALIGMLLSTLSLFLSNQVYVDKAKIKADITTLISNDAGLSTIKHVFNNKSLSKIKKFSLTFGKDENAYPDNVSLSQVLEDIKADLYLSGKPDQDKLTKINSIITANSAQNPFDGLPANQRDLFENIVTKSNAAYSVIQPEVNKLANELRIKNAQLEDNDTKVEVSYYITIISFITAIAIAAFQIFQSRPQKTKEIVVAALSEIEAKSEASPNNQSQPDA